MKIGCLLSIRNKSTRLPGKSLLKLNGFTLVERLIQRLKLAMLPSQVILSTSYHEDDEVLCELARKEGIPFYQGSQQDKLDRYYQTAKKFNLDAVVIVDGDDPLCFPEYIDTVADTLKSKNVDCVYIEGLPLGAASTGITTEALKKVLEIKDEEDTEVWGSYFIGNQFFKSHKIKALAPYISRKEMRLTVDYPDDFELISKIFDHFSTVPDFKSEKVIELLEVNHPEWLEINNDAQYLYEKHIERSAPVRFKSIQA